MKRFSQRQKYSQLIKIKKGIKRKRRKNGKPIKIGILRDSNGFRQVRLGQALAMPSTLCLDDTFDETISFFYEVRRRTLYPTKGVLLRPTGKKNSRIGWVRRYRDFSTLSHISAGAALILAAEFVRISQISGISPATVQRNSWDSYVATTLSRLGFFKILQLPEYLETPNDALIIEPMLSNSRAIGSGTSEAIKRLFSNVGENDAMRVTLSSAITDAMENVVQHAYPDDWIQLKRHVPQWWMAGAVDPIKKILTLAIYDQGISIPGTLSRKWSVEHLTELCMTLFKSPWKPDDTKFDGAAIHASTALGATSTGKQNRGRGLAKIKQVIDSCPSARLRIISRFGECVYQTGKDDIIRSLAKPLLGTYIEIEVPFGAW